MSRRTFLRYEQTGVYPLDTCYAAIDRVNIREAKPGLGIGATTATPRAKRLNLGFILRPSRWPRESWPRPRCSMPAPASTVDRAEEATEYASTPPCGRCRH